MAGRKKHLERLRNIGIMAHIDAGKTTVSERILLYTGRTHRLGEVHEGEATMDWMEQERERGITITSAVTSIDWGDHEVHLIDTPGHVDFTVEVERSLRVLDGVIALYDAVAGVEPQSETVWYQANRYDVPRLGFANKMDRVGADYMRTVEDVRDTLDAHPIPIQLPIGAEDRFEGVVDLIEMRALRFEEADFGSTVVAGEIPDELLDDAKAARIKMIELIADVDDAIALAYLEGEELDADTLKQALRNATIGLKAVPFLCGSGLRNKGVQPLLDAVVDFLPAPTDLPPVHGVTPDGDPAERPRTTDAPFSALVFKVQFIRNRKIVFARVYSGELEQGTRVLNTTQERKLRLKNLHRMHARRRERVERVSAGEIVALVDPRFATTGDTLADADAPIILERMETNKPVISVSVEPMALRDKEKLLEALEKATEEDPTLIVEEDEDTGELIMRGMGELHLEVVAEHIRRDFGVELRLGQPSVVRKETIRSEAEATATFERETDDERIFGEVSVRVRPRERGEGHAVSVSLPEDHDYVSDDLQAAALQGLEDAMAVGPNGEELIDVEAEVLRFGSDPEGSRTALGYRVAAGEAVRRALKQADAVILEPLMSVDVTVLEEHVGDVIGDLTVRGGNIEDVEDTGERSIVHGIVPLHKMFGYSNALRSMTQGRGVFSMTFRTFDFVPGH